MALTVGKLLAIIDADPSGFDRGLTEAELKMMGFQRDVNGRLHDIHGRFVAEGKASGKGFGEGAGREGAAALTKFIPSFSTLGKIMGGAWSFGFKPALIAGAVGAAAQLVVALAPAVGAVALMPAALLAAGVALGTFKVALSGVGDALKAGMAGDAQKFSEALKHLAPNAQAAVKALVGLKPALDQVKSTVQQNFFAGLAGDIKSIGGTYLPILRTELGYVATGFNEAFGEIAAMMRAEGFIDAVRSSLHNVMIAITAVAGTIPSFVSAFNDIATVGASFLPGLTAGLNDLADRFSLFIAKVTESGQLKQFIQGAITALSQLGTLLSGLGSIVSSIFQAMGAASGQAMGALGGLVGQLAAFFNSAQGMAILKDLFGILGQIADAVGGALSGVLTAIAPLLSALLTGLQPIIGLLTGQFLPIVVQLASSLASALVPVINALAPALLSVLQALMPVIALLGGALGQILIALAPVIAQLATMLGQVLVAAIVALTPTFEQLLPVVVEVAQRVFPAMLPVIDQLGRLFINLIAMITPFIPAITQVLVYLVRFSDSSRGMLPILTGVVGAVATVVGWLGHLWGWLARTAAAGDTWRNMWHAIAGFFVGIWHSIVGAFKSGTDSVGHGIDHAVAFVQALPGRILAALRALPGMLERAAKEAFDRFFFAVGFAIGSVIAFFRDLPGRIATIFVLIGTVISRGWDNAVAFWSALPARIGAILSNLWAGVTSSFSNGMRAIANFMATLPVIVGTFFISAYHTAVNWASNAINTVAGWWNTLPGRVGGALLSLYYAVLNGLNAAGSWLYNAGRNIVEGLIHGIEDMVGRAIDVVTRAMHDVYHGALHALGIESPSKLFAAIGHNTMLGFAQGVDGSAGLATAAVTRALSFGGAVGLGGAGGGAGSGTQSPAVVHAGDTHVYIDGKPLEDAYLRTMRRRPEQVALASQVGQRRLTFAGAGGSG